MAKRVYGAAKPVSDTAATGKEPVASLSAEQKDNVDAVKAPKRNIGKTAAIIGSSVAVGAVCILSFWKLAYDGGYGGRSAKTVAVDFAQAVSADSDDMWTYLPRSLRGMQMASSESVWEVDAGKSQIPITLSNLEVSDTKDLSSSASALEDGLKDVYGKSVNIRDAELVSLSTTVSFEVNDIEYSKDVNFDIICIKVGLKWYAYTGSNIDANNITLEPNIIPDEWYEDSSEDDTSEIDDSSIDDTEDDSSGADAPEIPEVNIYDGVTDDVIAGKVTIDGVDYTMPADYSKFSSLFVLNDNAIDDADRVISANNILRYLPVTFVDSSYVQSRPYLMVDIANANGTGGEDIDVADGVVTTLHIGKPTNSNIYPSVVLPGNVTLGTSYDDVLRVYGPQLISYTGDNEGIENLQLSDSVSIYQMRLGNDYNWLYLIFGSDNTLSAVRWYYYDLNGLK
jgi:hypothetical protein